jgi:hypothetical protein
MPRWFAFVIVLLQTACGSGGGTETTVPDGSVPDRLVGDGSFGDATSDAQAGMDGGDAGGGGSSSRTVFCGAAVCGLTGDGGITNCCTPDLGMTGTCVLYPTGCPSGGAYWNCNGQENCVSTASCCFFQGATGCLPIGDCAQTGGQDVCHTSTDCADGGVCCPLAKGSTFSVCTGGPCP